MLQPSTQRSIPLACRSDLISGTLSDAVDAEVIVKDPLSLEYFRLTRLQHRVLAALDGKRSLREILHIARDLTPLGASRGDILRIIADLGARGLLWHRRMGSAPMLQEAARKERVQRFWTTISNPFYIKLPGLHPVRLLLWLASLAGWIFSPVAASVVGCAIVASWLMFAAQFEALSSRIPTVSDLTSASGLFAFWLIVIALKIVHELSHGVACERFGAECRSIGLAFVFFSPCLYCDVTDAWMLKRKSRRIIVSLAGIYAELIVSTCCLWLWRLSAPGQFQNICWQIFLAGSLGTIAVNANPLLRYDGYYVLSDWLEVPNLRQQSRLVFQRLFFRPPPSTAIGATDTRTNFSLLAYGCASLALEASMLVGIATFLYSAAKDVGLQKFALVILLGGCLLTSVTWLMKGIWMPHRDEHPGRFGVRTIVSLMGTLALLVAGWHAPLPRAVFAPFGLEMQSAQRVYSETPGKLVRLYAQAGDRVEAGDVIAELESRELGEAMIRWDGLKAERTTELRMAHASQDADLAAMVSAVLASVERQIEFAHLEQERLMIRASVAGTIVTSEPAAPSEGASAGDVIELARQRQLDQLADATLPRGACLCEIAPDGRWQASLQVDQRQVAFLQEGDSVSLRLAAYPGTDLKGNVTAIGAAREVQATDAASTLDGGETLFRVTVSLEDSRLPFRSGMQGTARFYRPPLSVGDWVREEFHQLFVAR